METSDVSPDIKNYSMPRGRISFAQMADDGTMAGEVDLGNVTSLDLTNAATWKEHESSGAAVPVLDCKKPANQRYKVKFTPEEKSTANMALFFLADGESRKQQTGSIGGSVSKVCYLDRWIDLGYWRIEPGSVVVNGDNLSTFLATDFSVDYENGLLMIKTGNSKPIADLTALTITFTYADYSVPMFVPRTTPVVGFLRYRGTSEVGPRHSIKCWKVQISPDNALEFIRAQEYSGLSFSGDVFEDDDTGSHSANPSFEIVELSEASSYPPDITADFTWAVNESNPKQIDFTNTSTGSPDDFDWDWGDGSAHGTTESPSHEYADYSTEYTVVLTITKSGSTSTKTETIETGVEPVQLVADLQMNYDTTAYVPPSNPVWSFNIYTPGANKPIRFKNISTGNYIKSEWILALESGVNNVFALCNGWYGGVGTWTGGSITLTFLGVTITQDFDTNINTSVAALRAKLAAIPGVVSATMYGGSGITLTVAKTQEFPWMDIDQSDMVGTMLVDPNGFWHVNNDAIHTIPNVNVFSGIYGGLLRITDASDNTSVKRINSLLNQLFPPE